MTSNSKELIEQLQGEVETLRKELRETRELCAVKLAGPRATVLSEPIDRPMLSGGKMCEVGEITIADVLDQAAHDYQTKIRVLAELHDWKNTRTGSVQCQRCGDVAWSSEEMNTKCSGSIAAAIKARATQSPVDEGGR